jgi:hypothetical protein
MEKATYKKEIFDDFAGFCWELQGQNNPEYPNHAMPGP